MSMGGMFLICRACGGRLRVWKHFTGSGYTQVTTEQLQAYFEEHIEGCEGTERKDGYLADPPPFELIGEHELLNRLDKGEVR